MRKIGLLRILFSFLFSAVLMFSIGCGKSDAENEGAKPEISGKISEIGEISEENTMKTYKQISQEEAKKIMDSDPSAIIVDVREQSEFDEGHVKGAILMPYTEAETLAPKLLPDKNALILVYCRSGRRSKIAAQTLFDMGYTNVLEFGGIIDWKYEIVK